MIWQRLPLITVLEKCLAVKSSLTWSPQFQRRSRNASTIIIVRRSRVKPESPTGRLDIPRISGASVAVLCCGDSPARLLAGMNEALTTTVTIAYF
jgi:hypothetical protein